jgi:hypothetical protein
VFAASTLCLWKGLCAQKGNLASNHASVQHRDVPASPLVATRSRHQIRLSTWLIGVVRPQSRPRADKRLAERLRAGAAAGAGCAAAVAVNVYRRIAVRLPSSRFITALAAATSTIGVTSAVAVAIAMVLLR